MKTSLLLDELRPKINVRRYWVCWTFTISRETVVISSSHYVQFTVLAPQQTVCRTFAISCRLNLTFFASLLDVSVSFLIRFGRNTDQMSRMLLKLLYKISFVILPIYTALIHRLRWFRCMNKVQALISQFFRLYLLLDTIKYCYFERCPFVFF